MLFDCSIKPPKLNKVAMKTGQTASPTRKSETARPPKKTTEGEQGEGVLNMAANTTEFPKTDMSIIGALRRQMIITMVSCYLNHLFLMHSSQKRCILPSFFLVRKSARDFYVSFSVDIIAFQLLFLMISQFLVISLSQVNFKY